MTPMQTWLIEPHDPLSARDGRPFNNTPGARATSLPFPTPTMLAGAARTLAGSDPTSGRFTASTDHVLTWEMRGPLLVELRGATSDITWLVPAPADALLLRHDDMTKARRKQFVPIALPMDTLTDLKGSHKDLHLIGPRDYDPAKPLNAPPTFWYWQEALAWLTAPLHQDQDVTLSELGHRGPLPEGRVHVGIDPATQTASEGMLFQTRGLEFTHHQHGTPPLEVARLALALASNAPLRETVAPIGGERRLARWQAATTPLPGTAPEIEAISKAIAHTGGCRVLLLTPALFNGGFQPDAQSYLVQPSAGANLQISVCGVAVARAQVLSGWDMIVDNGTGKPKGAPKATRRFVPGGTVLFLKVTGDADAIQDWVKQHWMQCISDGKQERRDGFGLAVFGVWSGEPETIVWGKHHASTEEHTVTSEPYS